MKTTQHLFKLGLSGLKQLRPSPKQFSSASSRSISSSSTMAANSERMLRLSISHYKADSKTEAECHKFGTEDHAVKAAAIHAKHGIQMYAQVCTSSHPGVGKSESPSHETDRTDLRYCGM